MTEKIAEETVQQKAGRVGGNNVRFNEDVQNLYRYVHMNGLKREASMILKLVIDKLKPKKKTRRRRKKRANPPVSLQ